MPEGLHRFIEAQADPDSGYAVALFEIRSSAKQGHWIWYVFPQLHGLGSSQIARYFALFNVDEAVEYLNHPVLGCRMVEITEAVVKQLRRDSDLLTLMGSRIDVLKLISCMTLVQCIAERDGSLNRLARAATSILRVAEEQGFSRCSFTDQAFESSLH